MARDYRVIDTDIHNIVSERRVMDYLSEPWRSRYESGSRGPGHLGYWNPNGVMRSDTKLPDGTRIENSPQNLARHFLDVYDLEYGVLVPAGALHVGLSPDPDFAAAVVAANNDVIVDDWLPADPRFRASLVVSPADPTSAAAEIRRHGSHPGMVQVVMPSGARMPYGQRFFHPIYEAAQEMGLPVAIHPGSEGVGISGSPSAAGYPSTYIEWHTGLVGSYIAHLTSLVTEGVFQKFPRLKFVLIEGGVSWLPPILWRLDKNWKALRQTVPWLDRAPSEVVADHVMLTTQPIEEPNDPEHLRQLLRMFPAEKMLMFATDFPHWDGDTPEFAARWLPPELVDPVMGETARQLYGLPDAVDG
jgi:uncharacterized protein